MLFVYITDTCREDAKRHSMVSNLERLVKEIEKTQTTSAFDQFPKPYYVKKKFAGRQGRLIAAEKFVKVKGETHSVLALLAILIRGDGEYDSPTGFGHDPEGYGKKYLMPEFEALDFEAIVEERMRTEPPPQKDKLHDLEQMFLANDQRPGAASNEMMLCESKKWVDEVVKCEDLLPRLKDQILGISSLGCDESVDGVSQKTPVLQREDYEIAYQWLEGGRRLFLYDLVKQGVEPDGAIPRNKTEDIQKYLYREYPDWMLYDDKMWNDLEKDRFGNFSLSPEESRILHPTNSDGLQFPLFINGRAGSGKSTVLQYLYADYFSRYAKVGKAAGKPPAYFACNRELIRSAVDLVKSILLHNPKYCGGAEADTIKSFVNDEKLFDGSFRVYHEYLLSLVGRTDRNRFFPERRYLDYSRFAKKWQGKFGRTQNASRDYGVDLSWHVIRTYIKGLSMDDFLELSDYGNIAKNQQSVSLDVFEKVYKNVWDAWYRDLTDYQSGEKYWDDQDLVRYVLDNNLLPHDGNGFLGVFCDESQDFTHIELESFLRMSVYFERSIYPHDISKLPFVFAGDPYQTLNPTGFRWESVKAAFIEKFIFGICPIAKEFRTDYFTLEDLQNNYRSIPNIVRFGNSVQMLRGAKFQITDLKPQHEWKADAARPISYFKASDEHFWKEMLARDGVHIIVPCHAGEEFQYIEKDPLLKKYVQVDQKSQTTKPPVFSSVRAKGLEFPCVIAYGFGDSLQDGKLIDMSETATDDEREKFLPYEYFLNRLYVAVSRPRSQLYIVDTDSGKKKLWRFAETPTALKKLQQTVPHGSVWDEHLEPLQEGTSEHLDSDFEYNPEELAERFEKTGLAENDAAMMNYAAQYYQECKGKNEKALECLAIGLLFNRDYAGAAKKFTEMSNFAKAGECWWECGEKSGWDAMAKLAGRDPKLLIDPKYSIAKALSDRKQATAAGAMQKLLKKIEETGPEQFQSEKWVSAVTTLVEIAVSNTGKIPTSTMKSILDLVESGVCRSSEQFAEAMLENGDVQMARRFYEFAGVSKGAKYQRTMFVTTDYPACLSFYNHEDEKTRQETIDYYLKDKGAELVENGWRLAVASAFIQEGRAEEVVDVIAGIGDPATLRSLAGLISDKAWKAKVLGAADIIHLRTQSPEVGAQAVITHLEKGEDAWFWLRVLARIAEAKSGKPDVRTIETLRHKLRDLNIRWRKAPFTPGERERIVPIGEFGLALEKFGHAGDAAGFYKWHYGLTHDALVARRWFELQMQTLTQRHGREASNLRNEIESFAKETGMRPRSNHSAAEMFGFDWDSLLKALFVKPEAKPVEKKPTQVVEKTSFETKNETDAASKKEVVVPAKNAEVKRDEVKQEAVKSPDEERASEKPQAEEDASQTSESVKDTAVQSSEAVKVPAKSELQAVPDALKLTFFSSKGRLNIEDQDSGSQWNVSAKGVSVDGEPKGHVTKMQIEGTGFSVTSSATQIVLSDERCGYEFTIKL